jgi:phosphoadenosine phosphosulfate reductase
MSKERADHLCDQIFDYSAEDILNAAVEEFEGNIAFASSMGAEDQVITHMLAKLFVPVRIFTLDTGRLFYETYELIEKTEARYGLKIEILFPDTLQVEKMVKEKGINLFYQSIENRKLCCGVRKIEPLRRALAGLDAWITGLRREQSPTRTNMFPVEWDEGNGLVKVNPLLNWTEDQVWNYIRENKIPYNILHDKGFPSIGCQPCTRATEPGEDIRNGRWWWENPETKECGLHSGRVNNS